MRHVITCAHLSTYLKFLRYTFFCMSKMDMNISTRVVFHRPRRPANVLEKRTIKWMF